MTTADMYMFSDNMYILTEAAMAARASVRHKPVRIDQTKLNKARRVLGAATDTEALDRALTLVVSEAEVNVTLRQAAGKGALKKLFS